MNIQFLQTIHAAYELVQRYPRGAFRGYIKRHGV